MPKRRRNWVISRWSSVVRSTPSTRTLPASGVSRPIMCLSSTLLPVPEPPMITTDSPSAISRSHPSSTTFEPKLLLTPRKMILAGFSGGWVVIRIGAG